MCDPQLVGKISNMLTYKCIPNESLVSFYKMKKNLTIYQWTMTALGFLFRVNIKKFKLLQNFSWSHFSRKNKIRNYFY